MTNFHPPAGGAFSNNKNKGFGFVWTRLRQAGKPNFGYIRTSAAIVLFATLFLSSLPVQAATDVDETISKTKEDIQQLLEIKDDTTLSDEERGRLELQLKKNITMNIVDIASTQIKE